LVCQYTDKNAMGKGVELGKPAVVRACGAIARRISHRERHRP
jgi:hypothetical protein